MYIYSGIRSYIESRIRKGDAGFCEILGNVLKIPCQNVQHVPIEAIVCNPAIISLFAEEIKQLPARTRKKTLFRTETAQLGDLFGEESWDFAMQDYLSFASDLRRSEIIAFFRNRIMFVRKASSTISAPSGFGRREPEQDATRGIADKISYQFEKGRIINDLRSVSLIFLDLRGFTELSASDITDQELKEHLYTFFDPVVNIINHFGGTIKNYAGDGIFAAFGADSRHHNHALDAVRAAIEIRQFFTMLKDEGKMPFKGMGIGIHTGLVEEAYFFFDPHSAGFNTVIGLAANLVGRLSSGKAEKKKRLDRQTASSVLESLMASPNLDISLISNVEDMLFQVVDTFRRKPPTEWWRRYDELTVKVEQGILNNQGIAISGVENGTFGKIRASVDLKEIQIQRKVHYTFFDNVLHEQIVLIKAGDASFKGIDTGIEGKIPVWGVYLERNLPKTFTPPA
jgi:class 3 adenylate cyclase